MGFTPELVAVVWLGYDEPRSLKGSASQLALPVWLHFMQRATGGEVRGAFVPPPAVERIEIDPLTGARSLPGCPRGETEYFLAGTVPQETCPASPFTRRDRQRRESPGVIERLFERWLWDRRE